MTVVVGDIATAYWVDGVGPTGVACRGKIVSIEGGSVYMIDERKSRYFKTATKFVTLVADKEIISNPFAVQQPREENPFMEKPNPFAEQPMRNPFIEQPMRNPFIEQALPS